jgi:hypothetical protein
LLLEHPEEQRVPSGDLAHVRQKEQ